MNTGIYIFAWISLYIENIFVYVGIGWDGIVRLDVDPPVAFDHHSPSYQQDDDGRCEGYEIESPSFGMIVDDGGRVILS